MNFTNDSSINWIALIFAAVYALRLVEDRWLRRIVPRVADRIAGVMAWVGCQPKQREEGV